MRPVADVIVRRLRDAGVITLFGIPGGGSNLDLVDAARRAGLPFVLTATETGAALAALAQAEISGVPGACLTTLGPGAASVVNGVACAYLDRVPLLVFTDTYPAAAAGCDHQRLDHRALLGPITKWSATLSAENADAVLSEAIARARAGPPGPVHIDVPADVAPATCRGGPVCPPRDWRNPEQQEIGDARADTSVGPYDFESLVSSARRPLLLVGLGARRDADAAAIRSLCAARGVPAMVTYKAKGVIADGDPLFAGVFTNGAIEQPILDLADVFIAVGLDPVELLPRPWRRAQPVVACGRWRVEDRQIPLAAQWVSDIPGALNRIREILPPTECDLEDLRQTVLAQRRQLCVIGERLTPAQVVHVVADAAAATARVTIDAGAHMFPATMLWPVRAPNDLLISNGLSTMGFALPAAIGAALLDRDRAVVALTGDGGLLTCAGELLTAARERLRIITVVFSDASLSLIAVKQQQRHLAAAGVALGDVAWCALAESLGVSAQFASTEPELVGAVARALAHDGPSLIEARVDASSYAEVIRAVRG